MTENSASTEKTSTSEKPQFTPPKLSDLKAELREKKIEDLYALYQGFFKVVAKNDLKDKEEKLTSDRTTLIDKIAYAMLAAAYVKAKAEMPASVNARMNAVFDKKFRTVKPKEKRWTIQNEITQTLWGLVKSGKDGSLTTTKLGEMIAAKFPDSTYGNNPYGRMKVDINKFNTGAFSCQKEMGMVPKDDSEHYHPKPEPKKVKEKPEETTEKK